MTLPITGLSGNVDQLMMIDLHGLLLSASFDTSFSLSLELLTLLGISFVAGGLAGGLAGDGDCVGDANGGGNGVGVGVVVVVVTVQVVHDVGGGLIWSECKELLSSTVTLGGPQPL